MTIKLGVVMDPIEDIKAHKDTTLSMLLAAQARGWDIYYMTQNDLYLQDGTAFANTQRLNVADDNEHWFDYKDSQTIPLSDLDIILMRKDPPFDMEYIYTTYILERAEEQGVKVVNKPQALRDANEKLYTAWFPQCCPPTLVTRDAVLLREFLEKHDGGILKPLEGMGGSSIFHLKQHDINVNVVIETLTNYGQRYIMAQQFIPEISEGDKRILLVHGEPIPHALARIPSAGDPRGNIAHGATTKGLELSDRDRWICQQIGPTLKQKGLVFAGIDVIGDYLTEINVTSPTCIRELEGLYDLDIAGQFLDGLN